MSMIQCPECEKSISDKAETCPHCGFPISKELNREVSRLSEKYYSKKKSVGLAVLLAFILGPFGMFYASTTVGFIMILVWIFASLGGLYMLAIAAIVNMVVAAILTSEYNDKIETIRHSPSKEDKEEYDISSGW